MPAPDTFKSFVDVLNSRTWIGRAACADTDDPDAFFIVDGGRDPDAMTSKRALAAMEICGGCPVRVECLTEAMSIRSTEGLWAGTTTLDRNHVRHLPLNLAVEVLEAEFEKRFLRRKKAIIERKARKRRHPGS